MHQPKNYFSYERKLSTLPRLHAQLAEGLPTRSPLKYVAGEIRSLASTLGGQGVNHETKPLALIWYTFEMWVLFIIIVIIIFSWIEMN